MADSPIGAVVYGTDVSGDIDNEQIDTMRSAATPVGSAGQRSSPATGAAS